MEMEQIRLINLIFLCIVNGFFTLAGILLNSVVIISLWKAWQLRKKTCYFMIHVLSCFDLLVVIVAHPSTIFSAFVWANDSTVHWTANGGHQYDMNEIACIIRNFIQGFSGYALLAMTIDRYFAITRPLLHKTSVTKRRLMAILVSGLVLFTAFRVLRFTENLKVLNYVGAVTVMGVPLLFLGFMNYRMFAIAFSRGRNKVGSGGTARLALLKKNATCLLTVMCFFVCVTPLIVYAVLRATASSLLSEDMMLLLLLWGNTSLTLSSSFNCMIFFWKNEMQCAEAKKILCASFNNHSQ